MIDLTALTAEVERNSTVDGSATALIEGLVAQIEASKNDPAAIQAIVDTFRVQNDKLAAAVAANTPGAPVPPPVPSDRRR